MDSVDIGSIMHTIPDRNYADSDDKFLRQVVLYVGSKNKFIYTDKNLTTKIDAESLMDLLRKGMATFCYGEGYTNMYAYIWIKKNAFVSVHLVVGSKPFTFYSSEYVPPEDDSETTTDAPTD